jgi:hypothetical protein
MDTERYSILYQKWGKTKAPNLGLGGESVQSGTSSGIYAASPANAENRLSRATRIVKFDIPGSNFARNGLLCIAN